jgi:hypothetical protein
VERFYARLSADGFTLGERLIDCDLTTVKIGWEEPATGGAVPDCSGVNTRKEEE